MKACIKCFLYKEDAEFYIKDRKTGRLSSECRQCRKLFVDTAYRERNRKQIREYAKNWASINKDRIREYNKRGLPKARERYHSTYKEKDRAFRIKKTYGLTRDDFKKMVDDQNGLCIICKNPPVNNKKSKFLYVDHCHATGKVRGLLCHKCNNGLGCFNDKIELLREAIDYLQKRQYN